MEDVQKVVSFMNQSLLKNPEAIPPDIQSSLSKANIFLQSINTCPSIEQDSKLPQQSTLPEKDTNDYYQLAYNIHKDLAHHHFKRTKEAMNSLYPTLTSEPLDVFKNKCEEHFYLFRPENWAEPKRTFNLSFFKTNTNAFLYRNKPDGNQNVKHGAWSEEETKLLIDCIEAGIKENLDYMLPNGQVRWGLLSLRISGRVGYQCSQKYRQLVKIGRIPEIQEMVAANINGFTRYCQPAFLPYQLNRLRDAIDTSIEYRAHIGVNQIALMAIELYYEPSHLAAKAAVFELIGKGINPFDSTGACISDVEIGMQKYLEEARSQPHTLINRFNIPSFSASNSWISRFLNENNYVYRVPHYARRGAIDPKSVTIYLQHLSSAVQKYGRANVLNMDETHINLNNYSPKTIAKKGAQDVTIDVANKNDKAGTTYIGTIAMDPSVRFPLYLVAKGKTEKCEKKYNNTDRLRSEMDHSSSGWCTVDVMSRYLHWLSDCMGGKPFALVLDIYTTHIADEIREIATNLGIECIYVPANGTGQYQPLDRRIFGIMKKQLSKQENHSFQIEAAKPKELYGIVHQKVLKIWQNISTAAINSAWDINGLELPQV